MRVLVWGLTIFGGAFVAQFVWWRLRPPRRQIRALLRLFFGLIAVALAVGLAPPQPVLTTVQALHLLIFFTALTLAYVITYTAVQVDSPSLVIVSAVAASGERGLARAELLAMLTDDLLVRPRLMDLVRDEVVDFDGRVFRMRPRGSRLLALITGWRRLMGLPIRGG